MFLFFGCGFLVVILGGRYTILPPGMRSIGQAGRHCIRRGIENRIRSRCFSTKCARDHRGSFSQPKFERSLRSPQGGGHSLTSSTSRNNFPGCLDCNSLEILSTLTANFQNQLSPANLMPYTTQFPAHLLGSVSQIKPNSIRDIFSTKMVFISNCYWEVEVTIELTILCKWIAVGNHVYEISAKSRVNKTHLMRRWLAVMTCGQVRAFWDNPATLFQNLCNSWKPESTVVSTRKAHENAQETFLPIILHGH